MKHGEAEGARWRRAAAGRRQRGSLEVNCTKSFAVFFIRNGNVFLSILMAKHLLRVQKPI